MITLAAAAASEGFDVGALITQVIVSLLAPTVILAPFMIRYWRRSIAAGAAKDEAAADETDAKAEVLLSGEALELFRAARQDQALALDEAREARSEAAKCRRQNVELWTVIDAFDRHVRNLERAITEAHGTVPPRPLDLQHPLT